MEALDSKQSVGLPPINHLDPVRSKEVDYGRKHSAPSMVSSSYAYPGPPPSYSNHSNHQSSNASGGSGSLGGLLSPPESRRTSGDEKEQQRQQPTRQSLPSIHEALGSEQPLPYPAPPPSAPVSASQPYLSSTTASPAPQRTRASFSTDVHRQPPPNPYPHPRSPFTSTSAAPPPPPPPPAADPLPRTSFSAQHNNKLPTLHPLQTAHSPPPNGSRPHITYSAFPKQPASAQEAAPQSAGSMNPQYGYPPPYGHHYPLSAPAPSAGGHTYPPPAAYSAPPRYPPSSWRIDSVDIGRAEEKKPVRSNSVAPQQYGESVKRHLESFDLEASLNEMAEGSGRITDFSKVYRQRAHENQRMGIAPSSIPRLEEVDDMLRQSEKIQLSLQRMREVVHNHQQANLIEQQHNPQYRQGNGYEPEASSNYQEEGKGTGGFANGDTKKRRGRAAPPGRCHSCNRAETPEWRRGPDGARTLCNACGLHYAKLTRKMGNTKTGVGSNIQPKNGAAGA